MDSVGGGGRRVLLRGRQPVRQGADRVRRARRPADAGAQSVDGRRSGIEPLGCADP